MYLRFLFLIIAMLSVATLAAAQERSFECPKKSEYVSAKISEEIRENPPFAQREEYCRQKGNERTELKQGPYILWGPNGEKLEEGQFVDGKKDGKWSRWIPSQLQKEIWKDGVLIESSLAGEPGVYTVDFKACNPHEYNIPAALGSTSYRIIGKENESCVLNYNIEIELSLIPSEHPWTSCLVPQSKRRLSFNNTQLGLDFSGIREFCKLD